jgi:hypothetical protein
MVVYGFRPLPVMNETIFRMNSFIASAHAGTHKQTGVYSFFFFHNLATNESINFQI